MRSQILYVPEGIELQLSEPGFGHVNALEILERHHRQGSDYNPEYHRRNPAFICLRHVGGTNPGLYLKKVAGEWWAAHYESGICQDHRIPSPMTDEHKRQTEYWARAAEEAGWNVDLEYTLNTGTRPDALITGGSVQVGVEVQWSQISTIRAVNRTRKALAAGVLDVWFAGSDIHWVAGKPTPPWAHRVPTAGSTPRPWSRLPPPRAAAATGLREIVARRCAVGNFKVCPVTGRGRFCGKHHPADMPWLDVTVDDVAAMMPAGEIAPIRYRRDTRHDDVLLVSAESVALYEELIGHEAILEFHPKTEDKPPATPTGSVECGNQQPVTHLAMFTLPAATLPSQRTESFRTSPVRPRKAGVCAECGVSRVVNAGDRCQACRVIARMSGSS